MGVRNLRQQRGLSLTGLIVIMILAGLVAMVGMQVVPAVIEYQSIKKAVLEARNKGQSVTEIQTAYAKQALAGYFTAITAKDLEIEKSENGYEVSFAYEKKLPLFGPASLLLEFSSSTERKKK